MERRKIRILFLGKNASRGGGQRVQESIVKYLDHARWHPMIALAEGGAILENYQKYAETYVFSTPTPNRLTRSLNRITQHHRLPGLVRTLGQARATRSERRYQDAWASQLIRRVRPDLILRNYLYPIPIFDAVEQFRIPSIQHVFQKGSQIAWRADYELQNVVRHSQHFVCEGVGTRDYVESSWGLRSNQISMVCIGIDLERRDEELKNQRRVRRSDLAISADAVVIATAGSFLFLKGVDLWVRAAAILKARFPGRALKFLWVGGTDWQFRSLYGSSIRQLIQKLGLDRKVILAGDQTDVYPYLDLCDIYVQPSRDDAFPHSTLEAMALGKPVVAFAQGIALEKYAQHALVRVDVESPEALAQGIAQLIEQPALRQNLGRAGLALVQEHFDVARSVRQYEEVLSQVFDRHRHISAVAPAVEALAKPE